MSLYIRYPSENTGSGGGGSGSAGGNGSIATANLYDPVTTSVTSGPAIVSPFIVDGVTVTNNMLVLFSNLSSGNNEVYKASIVGPVITWSAQPIFAGNTTPIPPAGSLIVITQGTGFANQTGEFTGTTWLFNNTVRYFNGTDYFEQSSINTSTLTDNTTNGTVFSVAYAGSENIIVEYSVLRSGNKEIGTIYLTTDDTNVGIAVAGSATAPTGVSFSSVLSGSTIVLQYSTTSTGSDATMKYEIRRWSDSAGGPGGPPSYSGGGSSTPAAGSPGNIQFNTGGLLGASSNFNYDSSNNLFELGASQESILLSTTILDNQASPVTIVSMPSTYNSVFLNYTIIRSSAIRTGTILIATDGVTSGHDEQFAFNSDPGVTFTVSVSGGNINLQYTSTSTGSGGTFKYMFTRW